MDRIEITAVDTPSLGDRSYLVTDGRVAFAVDPQRDVDRMLALLERRHLRLTHVFETHIHNDYVTGGLALSRATGATYHVNADDPVPFERVPVSDGDEFRIGEVMRLRAVATPGHTHTHLSYVLTAPGRAPAVFSGGSLLFGSTGRPDLLGAEHTDELVHAQYRSAQRLAAQLPDEAEVYPTHGFGSFCSSTQAAADTSTIGREKATNAVYVRDEQGYVESLLAGLDAYPAYYAHMAPINLAGPPAPDLSPPTPADPAELRRRLEADEWVVDLRSRSAFAAGHLIGSLNFGLDGAFVTYLGWLIPWGTALTILGETPADIADAHRELARIGLERVAAAATGTPVRWSGGERLGGYPTADLVDLSAVLRHRAVVILDVRRRLEWEAAHLRGAVHVPLQELRERLDEVPEGEVWVHCGAGYRASIAASILDAVGRQVVLVDDDFARAGSAGLSLEGTEVTAG